MTNYQRYFSLSGNRLSELFFGNKGFHDNICSCEQVSKPASK